MPEALTVQDKTYALSIAGPRVAPLDTVSLCGALMTGPVQFPRPRILL
jgi:hypothetical protein